MSCTSTDRCYSARAVVAALEAAGLHAFPEETGGHVITVFVCPQRDGGYFTVAIGPFSHMAEPEPAEYVVVGPDGPDHVGETRSGLSLDELVRYCVELVRT